MKDRTMHNYFEYLDIFFPLEKSESPTLTFYTMKTPDIEVPTYKEWERMYAKNIRI